MLNSSCKMVESVENVLNALSTQHSLVIIIIIKIHQDTHEDVDGYNTTKVHSTHFSWPKCARQLSQTALFVLFCEFPKTTKKKFLFEIPLRFDSNRIDKVFH